MIVKPPAPSGASVSGEMIPCCLTDSTSSPICASSNSVRGLKSFCGLISSPAARSRPWRSSALTSLREQSKRAILERLRLGRPLEARLLVRAAGGRACPLHVIDIGRDRLQRAPTRALNVLEVGRRAVGGRDRLAHALDVAYCPPTVGLVGLRLGHRYELPEEARELWRDRKST